MSDKLSLEHIIRNIAAGNFKPSDEPKVTLEHTIRSIHESIGIIGSKEPVGTPSQFLTRRYKSQDGGHTSAGKGVHAKQKQADAIKMEGAPSDMSGVTAQWSSAESGKKIKKEEIGADSTPVSTWPTAESGKKKKVEECGATMSGQSNEVGDYGRNVKTEGGKKKKDCCDEEVSQGTKDREQIKNVSRPGDPNPKSPKSTLSRTAEIKQKIIDEAIKKNKEKDTTKFEGGKTPIVWDPKLKNATPEANEEVKIDEGLKDSIKKGARVGAVVGALGAHAGKAYDAGNVAMTDQPIHAVTTAMSYANPASRVLNMLPTAFKATQANKGEDELTNQLKTKLKKEETEMSEENNNPLIASFLELQAKNPENMFEAAKHLSTKQKKIAAMAGDKSKIDAADFAALRHGKKMEEETTQIDEIGNTPAGRNVLKNYIKKAGGGTVNSAVAHQANYSDAAPGGQLQKTSERKTINRVKGVERAADRLESVEFSAEELAHFDSVLEALGQSKDATSKGSFKKAGSTPNGDPVRPTVPTRDLTDDVNEGKADGSKMTDMDKHLKGYYNVFGRHPIQKGDKLSGIWNKPSSEMRTTKSGKIHGQDQKSKASEIKSRLGYHTKPGHLPEETIDEARGRPRKAPADKEEPQHTGRDPRQHIQVVAGQAAAGRHIEFTHNDGSKSTISPERGRKIVAHLNSLKPADRQSAVNKMHDSSKGM